MQPGLWTVHKETAANARQCHSGFMRLQVIKAMFAAAWIFAAVGIMVGSDHLTLTDRLTLGLLAIVPPVAMWFWGNDPVRTMSENIHEARDERRGRPEERRAGVKVQ